MRGFNKGPRDFKRREFDRPQVTHRTVCSKCGQQCEVPFIPSGSRPLIAEYISDLIDLYIDKKFIVFTSVENLESYIPSFNSRIIPWGGDITNHQQEYKTLSPITTKNLNSKYNYLSLNRNHRPHRSMLVALLHGLNIQNSGLISCMFKDKLIKLPKWKVSTDIFSKGLTKFKEVSMLLTDNEAIYEGSNNDNPSNFKNKLTPYYQNTFVEIITETSYIETAFNLTEKTLHSIYGCSFPILLSSQGSVAFLRSMGMDMFDDIINHSYDDIVDPADRMYCAITDNIEILTNNEKVKQLWVDNQARFANNVDFAKNKMYNFYTHRAEELFSKALQEFNIIGQDGQ